MLFPGHVYNRSVNYTDALHKIGDIVWTTYSGAKYSDGDATYEAEVIDVVSNDATKGMGTRYILYIRSVADDYVDMKPYYMVWPSKEAYEVDRLAAAESRKSFDESIKISMQKVKALNEHK